MIKIKLSIPEPCHENWNNMTPTEKGKHCSVCNKEVYDMTQMSEDEVAKNISKTESGNVCARIPNQYLDKKIELHAAGISGKGKLGIAGAVITAAAFTPIISTESAEFNLAEVTKSVSHSENIIKVSGTIFENENTVAGAKIIISQGENKATTLSISNGRFSFNLDGSKIKNGKAYLKIEKEGYLTCEKEIIIDGHLENGKFLLKKNIEIIELQAEVIPDKVVKYATVGQLAIMHEAVKEELMYEKYYEVTGGAVVHSYCVDLIEKNHTISNEDNINESSNENLKVVAVFENPNILKTYPNPTTYYVNIEMFYEGNYTVYIFDLTGKMIIQENFNSNKMQINLSAFERGNYIVKVLDTKTNEWFDGKVVLMR